MRFSSRGSGGPLGLARRLASVSSLGPLAAAALGVGLAHRNRRAGVNFLTRFWPGTVLALSGVKLNVTGAEHLTERRPAVFLFNFRSNVDVFLVAALVKDNWTGVASKELMSSHVFGQLGKLLDVAVVDREHPGTAATLKTLEAAARNGLSILIAPEGTRVDTQVGGPVQEAGLPHRDGDRPADRSDRDQELGVGRGQERGQAQPGYRRYRRAATRQRGRTGTCGTCGNGSSRSARPTSRR